MIRTDVELGWKTIPGHRHLTEGRENEDAVLATQDHPYFDALMIVADGMGGHPEPRLASQTAAAAARDFLSEAAHVDALVARRVDLGAVLGGAVDYANARIRRLASASEGQNGNSPGCTLTVAAIADGRMGVAHVGDGSVFLYRDQVLRPLAGGEARRLGSRPEEYLGRADRVRVEMAMEEARAGDRLLLCTDGLTRYFGSHGLERLQQVVARPTADPRALASQLTADGRGEEYEDDTTVVVAEVGRSREVPDAPVRSESAAVRHGPPGPAGAAMSSDPQPAASWPGRAARLLLLAVLVAGVGFYGGRVWQRPVAPPGPAFHSYPASLVSLPNLPSGGVVLMDQDTGRLFTLRTHPAAAPVSSGPLILSELRAVPGKGVRDTGNSFRLDPARGLLTDPGGKVYPITLDAATGVIEIQQGGTLRVTSQPSGLPLRVTIDGLNAGTTPLTAPVKAGRHQVQVEAPHGRTILYDEPVVVPPHVTASITVPAPSPGPRPGSSP